MSIDRKTALVTGSTGFIGSHLVTALIERNYHVSCLIRPSSRIDWIEKQPVRIYHGRYSDPDFLKQAVQKQDYIFHVGALINASCWEDFVKANIDSTRNLLEACALENPDLEKFVFVSSISAAGPASSGEPIDETRPCRPVSLYGRSKMLAEEVTAGYFTRLPVVILRPTNILGVGQKELLTVIKLARKRIIPMLGNGDRQTSVCFVDDLVRAMLTAAENPAARRKIYFVASPQAYSWREMVGIIKRSLTRSPVLKIPYPLLLIIATLLESFASISSKPPLISRGALKSVRKNYWLHDVNKIKKELGFVTRTGLEEGLDRIIRVYQEQGKI
jgi:nucleoside-diphosphate-sugar epimerase